MNATKQPCVLDQDTRMSIGTPTESNLPIVASIGDVARFLGFTERAIRDLVFRRRIPYFRPGGRVLKFYRPAVLAWIERSCAENMKK